MPDGTADAAQTLDERYGSSRRVRVDRRFAWIAAALLLAAGLGFLIFGGWHETSQVEAQDITWTRDGETAIDMKYQVAAPAQSHVACAVQALSKSKAIVGWKVVEIEPTDSHAQVLTTRVELASPAVAANVKECWVLE